VPLNHYRIGSGEPLVLVHGIGSQWQVWSPVIGRLAQERDVVALDLPGFGASPPHPPGTRAGIESLTRLVAEFLDELGLERPHVAGNSLGGWIALELAKLNLVRSATVLSPAGFATPAENLYVRNMFRLVVRIARRLAPRAESVTATAFGRIASVGIFVARPANLPAAAAAESTRALAGAEWFDETLKAITTSSFSAGELIHVPVTVAWAEHDSVLWFRQAARAAAAIPGARAVTLTGCGHVPTWDDPEQVARVILDGSSTG
jgi:pimeloyl-ACP methyl ester carboxylesterase